MNDRSFFLPLFFFTSLIIVGGCADTESQLEKNKSKDITLAKIAEATVMEREGWNRKVRVVSGRLIDGERMFIVRPIPFAPGEQIYVVIKNGEVTSYEYGE